mgnify:CR=1 FL=1
MNRATILEEIRRNVDLLSVTDQPEYQYIPLHQKPSPSVTALREIMTLLRKVIFPGFFGTEQEAQTDSIQYYTGVYLEQAYDLLQEQIYNGLCFEVERCCDSKDRASEIAIAFINKVPHIKYLLSTDVKAILDGDPAAKSPSEIIFCYPAIHAILYQRVAHELLKLGVPVIPRIITEMAHSPLSRCDIGCKKLYLGRRRIASGRTAPSDYRRLCYNLFQCLHFREDHYWSRLRDWW